jgi:DNA invertase Pin-like site-specific DNA recombinase
MQYVVLLKASASTLASLEASPRGTGLSRSLKDLLTILERVSAAGGKLRSLFESIDTSGPAGRMLMQMLGSFAEFEREMIRERTRRTA